MSRATGNPTPETQQASSGAILQAEQILQPFETMYTDRQRTAEASAAARFLQSQIDDLIDIYKGEADDKSSSTSTDSSETSSDTSDFRPKHTSDSRPKNKSDSKTKIYDRLHAAPVHLLEHAEMINKWLDTLPNQPPSPCTAPVATTPVAPSFQQFLASRPRPHPLAKQGAVQFISVFSADSDSESCYSQYDGGRNGPNGTISALVQAAPEQSQRAGIEELEKMGMSDADAGVDTRSSSTNIPNLPEELTLSNICRDLRDRAGLEARDHVFFTASLLEQSSTVSSPKGAWEAEIDPIPVQTTARTRALFTGLFDAPIFRSNTKALVDWRLRLDLVFEQIRVVVPITTAGPASAIGGRDRRHTGESVCLTPPESVEDDEA